MRTSILPTLIALCILLTAGCSTATITGPTPGNDSKMPAPMMAPANNPEDSRLGWRRIMFQHQWDPNEDPDWSMDLLIAGELLAPSIEKHQSALPLWRFHRRAGRGSAGHQLSLLIYTDQATARTIYDEIIAHPWTQKILAKKLRRIIHRGLSSNPQPLIEDSSDPNWSHEMQRAWPYYIKGISEMWLSLLTQYRQQAGTVGTLDEAIIEYQALDQRLTETWENEGQHAFLHHLNAVFGYQPLYIRY